MRTYQEYLAYINSQMEKSPYLGHPIEVYEPINYILSLGGKRMRPVLTLMGCELFGGRMEDALKQAMGIEVFHNFSLLHDDIMDHAPLRRGQPTVHVKWNEPTAILSGDLMLIKSVGLVKDSANDADRLLDSFLKTAAEVCEGQQMDMNFEDKHEIHEQEYIEMIRLKTAVLLGFALEAGAIVANATLDDCKTIYTFGESVGIGFQLMDDILDVFGNQAAVGKQVGGDILSNKKTFLLIKARELATGDAAHKLHYWTTVDDFDPQEKVSAVIDIYNQLGIKELATAKSEEYFHKAYTLLEGLHINAENKKYLHDFCEWLKTGLAKL